MEQEAVHSTENNTKLYRSILGGCEVSAWEAEKKTLISLLVVRLNK
jgi:hypothetical protein